MSDDIAERLTEVLSKGVSDDAVKALKKKVDDILYTIEDDIMYRLKDELAPNLSAFVEEMAKRTVEMLLAGNEDQMRRYLGCERGGWNGRSDGDTWNPRPIEQWHPVIHGKLFEQGALAVRKGIVEAHADLLKTERIRDLEDQVKALVVQVNKLNTEKEEVWRRLRDCNPAA
jgi:hypothetical protein